MNAVKIIQYGGLAFSGILTLSLFVRLYGNGPYGWLMGLAALALFEVGAGSWLHTLGQAKHRQRTIVRAAMWWCVLASILSSASEIILSTNLWEPAFDIEFWTLIVIAGSLAVNLVGGLLYEMNDPDKAERARELDQRASMKEAAWRIEDKVLTDSISKAEQDTDSISQAVADALRGEIRTDSVGFLLGLTRNGASRQPQLPAPQPAQVVEKDTAEIDRPAIPVVSKPPVANGRKEPENAFLRR